MPREQGLRADPFFAALPLEKYSHDPAQQYFADGMTEELIADLAKIRSLRVLSRTSAMSYKGTKKSVPQIAHDVASRFEALDLPEWLYRYFGVHAPAEGAATRRP
ncbi:MAG: hypothetical protein ABI914_06155 [Acidobacteriota bacterium]